MDEIEVKYAIDDANWLKKRIKTIGAEYDGTFLQKDIWFTSSSRYFKRNGLSLRLRRQGKITTMTLKKAVKTSRKYRYAKEVEFEIGNFAKAETFLKKLGYDENYRMRKRRSVWKLDGLEIVLDVVDDLGTFVELEGTELQIEKGIVKLGLEMLPRITRDYGWLINDKK